VEKPHPVRAGHDTIATANAPGAVHQDHPIGSLIGGSYWAYLDARGFIALVAQLGHKEGFVNPVRGNILELSPPQINPGGDEPVTGFLRSIGQDLSFFGNHIALHPGPGDVGLEGDFIFELTGFNTIAAADAFVRVHQKCPAYGPRRSI
jgi:hypothetical protein